jgi:glycosyltransferase involved in cell wall biosynthesis
MEKISVCMATFNGEKYVERQLISILSQLRPHDEVVISDDSSTDRTIDVIEGLNDPRIKILKNQKFRNPIFNFENALLHAQGDFLFLSDQDDLWMPGKVDLVMQSFKNHDLVLTDCEIIDSEDRVIEKSFFRINKSGPGFWWNLHHNSYLGCCLAMRKAVVRKATPFPKDIPMHDWWIGIVCERFFRIAIIDKPLIKYRRHGLNATTSGEQSTTTLIKKLKFRFALVKGLIRLKSASKTSSGIS